MPDEQPVLYIVPAPINENRIDTLSPEIIEILTRVKAFVVEKKKTSRRFLKRIDPNCDVNELAFLEMDKSGHYLTSGELSGLLKRGGELALLSEAGLPCVADPGREVVQLARIMGFRIQPLSGPSSLFLALMASGLNGQEFCFHGYLPIEKGALSKKLKQMERDMRNTGASQIFIETPYRNKRLIETMIQKLEKGWWLCMACDIGGAEEWIETKRIAEWQKGIEKDVGRKLAMVFVLGSG